MLEENMDKKFENEFMKEGHPKYKGLLRNKFQ